MSNYMPGYANWEGDSGRHAARTKAHIPADGYNYQHGDKLTPGYNPGTWLYRYEAQHGRHLSSPPVDPPERKTVIF